ncbi:MAG: type II toxin-antitoxin system HigB family toxin [Leptospiraceae bacterium]|nr:type II toxin-antitoxin system HigB family toxin [Leptospiraceae bacterium]
MHVISWRKISLFIEKHPNSASPLQAWYKIVKNSNFKSFNDLKKTFNSVDQVGKFTVFNVGGNNFRVIASIHFNRSKVYIRHVLSHSEYDKDKWKEK